MHYVCMCMCVYTHVYALFPVVSTAFVSANRIIYGMISPFSSSRLPTANITPQGPNFYAESAKEGLHFNLQ